MKIPAGRQGEMKIKNFSKTMKKMTKQQLELKKLEQEISELKAGWQRTQADFDNFRNRTTKEKIDIIKCSNQELIGEILPVLDNFERALSHRLSLNSHAELVSASQSEIPKLVRDDIDVKLKQINDYITGLEYIKIQLEQILNNYGLEKIPTKIGDRFDPTIHEAVEAVEDKKLKKDQIAQIVSNGYKLNGSVIRPVKVKVAG